MNYKKTFKLKCINTRKCSIGSHAINLGVPKQTLARWIRLYARYGESGLENKKPGVKEKPINPYIEKKVLSFWKQKKRSAYKMSKDIEKKNHLSNPISKRQIYKIYKKHKLKI